MKTAELHTLAGAYALHALPDEEGAAFEEHLAACPSCAQEVAELRATGARLGLAVAEQPPAALRARVLARIRDVRQDPPLPSLTEKRRGNGPEEADGAEGGGQDLRQGQGPRRGRVRRWREFALAACLVAAALGGVAIWQQRDADDARQSSARERARSAELAELLAAPDARTVARTELPGGGSGTTVVSRRLDKAAFVASGMAQPPDGKVYQFWYDDDGTMRAAGLMDSVPASDAVLLDGKVDGAKGMGITVEPQGGSAEPTSKPVVLMAFPSARG